MKSTKIAAGSTFPSLPAQTLAGDTVDLARPADGAKWKILVVYRGQHCPLCTKYLNKLEEHVQSLVDIGVDVAAVSGDSRAQLASHMEKLDVSFPIFHGLTIEQMQTLGLYISHPRSEKETDHPFPEPGLFVINADNKVQVVDVSNNPFVRPELAALVSGLQWIKDPENDYPIRGTYR